MFDLPAHLARSTRACRHEPVESNSSWTDWFDAVPAAEEAVSVLGSSVSIVSIVDLAPLLVATSVHVRPLSTEMNTRALSRMVLPCASCVSRK